MESTGLTSVTPRGLRGLLFASILILLPISAMEILAYFFCNQFRYELFSYEDEYFSTVSQDDFLAYLKSPYFDSQLGWNNPTLPTHRTQASCLGISIGYDYVDGYRVSSGDSAPAAVYLFGDSYVHGDEVRNEATIASLLWTDYGIPTRNFGVPGYGTDQALGKFKQVAASNQLPPTSVLVVQHENIRRIVNSFRPVYSPPGLAFGLKPYVKDMRTVDLSFPTNFDEFKREARNRFENDYWSKPKLRFPYTVSMGRAMLQRNFRTMVWSVLFGAFSYEYAVDSALQDNLHYVLDEFVATASASGTRPLIVFIPRDRRSYQASFRLVDKMNAGLGRAVAYEFVDVDIDWPRFNLKPNGDCHPSQYGYERLARFIAGRVRAAQPAPASPLVPAQVRPGAGGASDRN